MTNAIRRTAAAMVLAAAWLGAAPVSAASEAKPADAQIVTWLEQMWNPAKHSRELSRKALMGLVRADAGHVLERFKILYAKGPDDPGLEADVRVRLRVWIAKTLNNLVIVRSNPKFADPAFAKAVHAWFTQLLADPEIRSHENRVVWLQAANNLKMSKDLRVVDLYIDRMTDPDTSRRFRKARVASFNHLLATNWNPEAFNDPDRLPELRKELKAWWAERKPLAEYFFQEGKITKPYIRVNRLALGKHAKTNAYPAFDYVVQWIATNSAYKVRCDEAIRTKRLERRLEAEAKTLPELIRKIAGAAGLSVRIDEKNKEVIFERGATP